MPVIDVQVHPFDRDHPGRPWAGPSHGLASASGEEMVAAMDSVGVDAAVMVSSFAAYRYDFSYALEVYNKYPDRFRVVTPVDTTDPGLDEMVAEWAKTPGTVGIRVPDYSIALQLVGLLGHPIISTSASLPDSPVESDPYEIEARFKPHLGLVIDAGIILPAPSSIISLIDDVPEVIREGKGPVGLFA